MFFDMLSEIAGHETLPGIEVFKENKPSVFSARFKTHGYGVVITADATTNNGNGTFYSIAKPLFTDPNDDDSIELVVGPLNYDTLYMFKDILIQLLIQKN